jgi:hypothetical protein
MIRAFFLLAIAIAAVPALAFVHCDSAEKSLESWRNAEPWRKALAEKKVAELEKIFGGVLTAYAQDKITDADVNWDFGMFGTSRAANEPIHAEWVKAYPKSEAAHLAQAIYHISRAWAARGTDFSDKTAQTQFAAMEASFEKAWRALDAAEALSKRPTIESARRLEILKAFGSRADEEGADIYRKALKRDPKAVQLRVYYIRSNAPRWGGSLQKMAQIGEEAKTLNPDDRRWVEYNVNLHTGADYDLRKDDKRAAEYLERAMPMCPGQSGAAADAMHLYIRTKNYPALIAASTRYIALEPGEGWGWSTRAWAYTNSNKLYEAFKDYERGTQLGYGHSFAGLAWFYEGARGGATQDFRKAIDLYMIAYEKGVTDAKEKADKIRAGTGLK